MTLNAVATNLGIHLRDGHVQVEGDLDFRGTLSVAKDTPVGFTGHSAEDSNRCRYHSGRARQTVRVDGAVLCRLPDAEDGTGSFDRDDIKATSMPKFVIERDVPEAGNLTADELREVSLRSLQALGELGPKIQWIHSFVTDNKIYCVYLAPDEATVRKHAEMSGIPASRISAVRQLLDPANYA